MVHLKKHERRGDQTEQIKFAQKTTRKDNEAKEAIFCCQLSNC